jgi:molybdopterin converting factor small subunit
MAGEARVEVFPWLGRALGKGRKVVLCEKIRKGENLKSFLDRIAQKHEGFEAIYDIRRGKIHDGVVIFVNNQSTPKDLGLKLKNGDTIAITPYYSGG